MSANTGVPEPEENVTIEEVQATPRDGREFLDDPVALLERRRC